MSFSTLQRVLTGDREILLTELDAVADALGLIGWQVLYEAEVGVAWDESSWVLAASDADIDGQVETWSEA